MAINEKELKFGPVLEERDIFGLTERHWNWIVGAFVVLGAALAIYSLIPHGV